MYRVGKYRRKVVRGNLLRSFPEKTDAERLQIERKFYRYLSDYMLEDLKLLHMSCLLYTSHTHAIITADAMTMGKHVYCQKPLTHSVYESRLLTKLAASTGVVTQMGNQGSSDEGTDLVCEWIWNGEIGDITLSLIHISPSVS